MDGGRRAAGPAASARRPRRLRPSFPGLCGNDGYMANPAILTVDDDPAVSRAVARDLRRQYGDRYRVVRAVSGARGAGGAARDQAARRAGRAPARRLPDAADERDRVPRGGDGPVPARPPRAADRVRGHRRGDRRHQRRRPRPLPAQAVEPAGGEAVPGGGHAAGGVARPRLSRATSRPGWSGTAGRRRRSRSATSWPATSCPTGGCWPTSRRAGACWPPPGSTAADVPLVITPDGKALVAAHRGASWPRSVGLSTVRPRTSTTWSWSGRARPGSAPPSTAPPRGCARCWSSGRPPAGRPGRAAGSRTTSASPTASPAPS